MCETGLTTEFLRPRSLSCIHLCFLHSTAHSEYPSGSAILCTASLEVTEYFLQDKAKQLGLDKVPPYYEVLPANAFPFRLPIDIPLYFPSTAAAVEVCGYSRMSAGVHFRPSVPAGFKLGKGLGKFAYDHVQDLIAGRTPKICARCAGAKGPDDEADATP
jgi:hypothetical protein